MNGEQTHLSVLLLETMYDDDVAQGTLPGLRLAQLLDLMAIPNRYEQVEDWLDLSTTLAQISSSHGVLHLSAHGDVDGIHTTAEDDLRWGHVLGMLAPHAAQKCVVLSACESAAANAVADRLAALLGAESPDPGISRFFRGLDSAPPQHLITYEDSPGYAHDALTLGVFYAHLAAAGERWMDGGVVAKAIGSAQAAGLARIVGRSLADGTYVPIS
jgi:hypothetical protein